MIRTSSRALLKSRAAPVAAVLPPTSYRAPSCLASKFHSSTPRPSTSASGPQPTSTPTSTPKPTNLPGANLPPRLTKYSPLTVSVVTTLAKLFGYNSQKSTAIRTTSDYYDRCAERGEVEAPFFYEECALPPSFQTWFSITTLHIWLLTVRFRALPNPAGQIYIQELINHFFIDVELRIRGPYAVTQGRLIKGYMKDMLEQYRGAVTAYDEGLIAGDPVLAAAIWRNLFGAGWGAVGGVKGKKAPKAGEAPTLGPNPLSNATEELAVDPVQQSLIKKGKSSKDIFNTDEPIIDPARLSATKSPSTTSLFPEHPDLEFAQSLEKIVIFVRKELFRLERLSQDNVLLGKPKDGAGSIMDFTKI